MGPAPLRQRALATLLIPLFLATAFAGCGSKSFSVDIALWQAGYAWEYDEQTVRSLRISGQTPAFLTDVEEEGDVVTNNTLRIEIFNSTAASVEGIPIYAAAVLQRSVPDNNSEEEEEVEEPVDTWSAWIFTADLNVVQPTYVDWRNQEVQLSGEEGGVSEEGAEAANESANQPQNEERLLDWPLRNGHKWRHAEQVRALDAEGVYDGEVTGMGKVSTPAGSFEVVKVKGLVQPVDIGEIEDDIRDSLESQGSDVDELDFDFSERLTYTYSDKVLNLVTYEKVQTLRLKAEGQDDSGEDFDFTFTETTTVRRQLTTYQTESSVEKALTFALEVLRGSYAPKPITPASHLAVEVLATTQGVNTYTEDKVTFGVRIYNSTAGEKKLRGPADAYPKDVFENEFNARFDHSYLEIVWQFDAVDRTNKLVPFKTVTSDTVTMNAGDWPTQGWKQVSASLRLKNAENTTDPIIFTDYVAFEVYYHGNMTGTRPAGNVTPENPRVSFPVEPSATRVTINGILLGGQPPETHCVIAGSTDCILVYDNGNKRVVDDRSDRMKFETTRLGNYASGLWKAEYNPSTPGQSVQYEIIVRYRSGA